MANEKDPTFEIFAYANERTAIKTFKWRSLNFHLFFLEEVEKKNFLKLPVETEHGRILKNILNWLQNVQHRHVDADIAYIGNKYLTVSLHVCSVFANRAHSKPIIHLIVCTSFSICVCVSFIFSILSHSVFDCFSHTVAKSKQIYVVAERTSDPVIELLSVI